MNRLHPSTAIPAGFSMLFPGKGHKNTIKKSSLAGAFLDGNKKNGPNRPQNPLSNAFCPGMLSAQINLPALPIQLYACHLFHYHQTYLLSVQNISGNRLYYSSPTSHRQDKFSLHA